MDKIKLSCVLRDTGKSVNKKLRVDGLIPAVIYGGKENLSVAVNAREFERSFHVVSENTIIELSIDKKKYQVLIKDYQKNWLKNKMQHIDFIEVTKDKELKTKIPLKVTGAGESVGERAGGLLEVLIHEIAVTCLLKDLPDEIVIDIKDLDVGQSIHLADIKLPKGVTSLTSLDQVIVLMEHASKASSTDVADEEVVAEETEAVE